MKVICDREALLEAVNLASRAVATRTPRPQLTCLLLTAESGDDGGHLILSATDGDVSMRLASTQVEVQEAGRCLIPADKVKQIVQAEDNEPTLTITTEGDAAEIRGADAFFKVFGYPAGDFPVSAEVEPSGSEPSEGTGSAARAGVAASVNERAVSAAIGRSKRFMSPFEVPRLARELNEDRWRAALGPVRPAPRDPARPRDPRPPHASPPCEPS